MLLRKRFSYLEMPECSRMGKSLQLICSSVGTFELTIKPRVVQNKTGPQPYLVSSWPWGAPDTGAEELSHFTVSEITTVLKPIKDLLPSMKWCGTSSSVPWRLEQFGKAKTAKRYAWCEPKPAQCTTALGHSVSLPLSHTQEKSLKVLVNTGQSMPGAVCVQGHSLRSVFEITPTSLFF